MPDGSSRDLDRPQTGPNSPDQIPRTGADQVLPHSERLYSTLVNSLGGIVWEADGETLQFTFVSPQAERMLGYPIRQWLGEPDFWRNHTHPADAGWCVAYRLDASAHRRDHAFEYRMIAADGRVVWLHDIVSIGVEPGGHTRLRGIMLDVTERKRVELALSESESRWSIIFNESAIGIALVDLRGHPVQSNPAFQKMLGYTNEELRRMAFAEFTYPDDVSKDMALYQEMIEGKRNHYRMEKRFRRKDGAIVRVNLTASAIRDESGQLLFGLGMAEDITGRRLAEERLRVAEEQMSLIVNSAPLILFACDEKGMVTLSEGEGLRGLGLRPGELVGQSVFEVYGDASLQEYTGAETTVEWVIRRVLSGETVKGISEVNGIYHDNHFVPAFDKSGRVIGVVCVSTDITDRKRMEDALKQSEHDYRRLFEQAHDAIIIFEPDKEVVLEVNQQACEMYGYSRGEFIGMSLSAASVNPGRGRSRLEEMLERGNKRNFETIQRRKDGSEMLLEVNAAVIEYKGRKAILSINRDVTERRRLEDQLRQAQKMEAVGQLAGGVAHDFNNLLTAITGYSDLALRQLSPGDPLRRNLDEIKKAGDRAAALTRQLLAFSRKQVLQPQVLNINTIVADMTRMLPRLIGENIDLETRLDPEIGSVKADPGQIEQVILNLVVNARDAMPLGGRLSIETQNVYLDKAYASAQLSAISGYYVLISVSDTGVGIDEPTRNRIFEPFFTTKEPGKGTGLGLSTVYGIVKQSDGHIFVDSEVGMGSTFKVFLPRVDERAGEYHRGAGVQEISKGTETILLVEDEELVRSLTREVLEMSGYGVLEAANARAALLICEQHGGPIQLLLTDVVMPEMSGRVLAERLLRMRPEMRVLYMSGYTDDAIVQHGVLEEGMSFIQKPFSPDALTARVREVLDS